jgi:hypothetical protein
VVVKAMMMERWLSSARYLLQQRKHARFFIEWCRRERWVGVQHFAKTIENVVFGL